MSLSEQLTHLQWKQLQHDERYHKDIWLLKVDQRLKHMTLHFAKYSGKLAAAAFDDDRPACTAILVDTLIIALSTSNILSLNLALHFAEYHPHCHSVDDLGRRLLDQKHKEFGSLSHIDRRLSIVTGKMAKACEALDHLEAFDYRESLNTAVADIVELSLAALKLLDCQKIEQALAERLASVERKSMFFEKLGNYAGGY
jgi:hypothetical protein